MTLKAFRHENIVFSQPINVRKDTGHRETKALIKRERMSARGGELPELVENIRIEILTV